ncbi:MAG: F0F1 ATP synthase subunit gamma [Pseudomonadota bacterium]
MGRYREVVQQLEQLEELRGIIASMKTLAQLELHKLGGLAEEQHGMMTLLSRVGSDFLHFYPQPTQRDGATLWLLIGSERGFCGDFNEALVHALQAHCPDCRHHPERVIGVGRKLWLRLDEQLPGYLPLPGASVSEEVPPVLSGLVAAMQQQMFEQQASRLKLISHGSTRGEVEVVQLLPPTLGEQQSTLTTAPLLQLPPAQFFHQFLRHYLYLFLSNRFSLSLLAENRHRVQHLEGAVQRLDDRLVTLTSRGRSLRQEAITEEIETILLSSEI